MGFRKRKRPTDDSELMRQMAQVGRTAANREMVAALSERADCVEVIPCAGTAQDEGGGVYVVSILIFEHPDYVEAALVGPGGEVAYQRVLAEDLVRPTWD